MTWRPASELEGGGVKDLGEDMVEVGELEGDFDMDIRLAELGAVEVIIVCCEMKLLLLYFCCASCERRRRFDR